MSAVEENTTISFARPDWRERIMSGRSLLPDLPTDRPTTSESAEIAVEVWGGLKVPDVEGSPLFSAVGVPWFKDFLHSMFLMDGPRRVAREAFVMVPKKSGLSTNCAALMLTALIVNKRIGAEFAMLGATMEVAGDLFWLMSWMINADDNLAALFVVRKYRREIEHRLTGAKAIVRALDSDALSGARLCGVVVDHVEFLRQRRFADALREVRGSMIRYEDSFLILAGRQSIEPPAGVFLKELERARATRDGKIDGGVLPLIYEPPEGVDWRDPANFPLLHPGFGYTVAAEMLAQVIAEADQHGYAAEWAAQWFNVQAVAQ